MKKPFFLLISFLLNSAFIHAQKIMHLRYEILQSYMRKEEFNEESAKKLNFEDTSGAIFLLKEYKTGEGITAIVIDEKNFSEALFLVTYSKEFKKNEKGEALVYKSFELNSMEEYKVIVIDRVLFFYWFVIKSDKSFWAVFKTFSVAQSEIMDIDEDSQESEEGEENPGKPVKQP